MIDWVYFLQHCYYDILGLICRQYIYGDAHVSLEFIQISFKRIVGIGIEGYQHKAATLGDVVVIYKELWLKVKRGVGLIHDLSPSA
jgi:hypothetical protein